MIPTEWPAPAKLNLFLHICDRREDGYHLLQTVFQLLDYGDSLQFSLRSDGRVRRVSDLPGIPAAEDLAVRAARLLQKTARCRLGVDIHIDKRLPIGGGLGGGSSNAATTMVALNKLWNTGLDVEALSQLGLQLGADVPVFIRGLSSWGENIGDELTPLELGTRWYVVVSPEVQVSTQQVFTASGLTRDTPRITMSAFRADQVRNDCEPVVRRLHPEVAQALDWLAQFGQARLTGTGGCVFAVFGSERQARAVCAQAPAPWKAFVARGVDVSPLRRVTERQAA